MKKIITLLSFLAIIIIACETSTKTNGVLSKPDDIAADEYTISVDRDTTLLTKNGALLKIPKGSLATENGSAVTLEIKEAYSIEQMIKTGLTTQSNGELLSSGGMIYINAKGGQNVTIKQAIKVAIPSNYLNKDMQLFNGEKDKEGNINWVNPVPLPENKQLNAIETGKQLFENKCKSCHDIGKDGTGPNLAHIVKRLPLYGEAFWGFYEHGINSMREFDSKYYHPDIVDIYKCNLRDIYRSTGPRLFTDTSNSNILTVYNYIQNESDRNQLPLPRHAYLMDCADSCINYYETVTNLKEQKKIAETKRENQIKNNGDLVEEKKIPATPSVTGTIPTQPNFDEIVSPERYGSVYYQFTIETFGWFNIDILVKGYNGFEESELFVRIVGQYREKIQVYLIIPSAKVYVQGGPAERNNEEFAFLYKNGKIALPQGAKAYIMAVTEAESSIAFALKEFTTGLKQEFNISLQQSTKEAFNQAINSISGSDIKISVDDSKNAAEIRKSDADLKTINENLKKAENLKPKNCDCNCGDEDSAGKFDKTDIATEANFISVDKSPNE